MALGLQTEASLVSESSGGDPNSAVEVATGSDDLDSDDLDSDDLDSDDLVALSHLTDVAARALSLSNEAILANLQLRPELQLRMWNEISTMVRTLTAAHKSISSTTDHVQNGAA